VNDLTAVAAVPRSFQRIAPDYSFQKVAAAIRAAIVRGELRPGDRLPAQRELQEVFGVSKVTILGALRILETDGLIEVQVGRNGGAVVVDGANHSLNRAIGLLLDMEQVNLAEVAELRDTVELQIARLAARRASPEQVVRLEDLLARLEANSQETAPVPDGEPYVVHDLRFHSALADASGNRLLSACMQVLYHHLVRHPVPVTPWQRVELNRSLRALLDQGIKAGRPAVAAEAMATHLADSYRISKSAQDGQ